MSIKDRPFTRIFIIKPLIFIILCAGFFIYYNHFLVNYNIIVLQNSFADMALADNIRPASYLSPIFQLQLADEMSSEQTPDETLIQTQYAEYVTSLTGERPSTDLAGMAKNFIDKEKERKQGFLKGIESIIYYIRQIRIRVSSYFRKVPADHEAGYAALDEIKHLESQGEYKQAIEKAEEFLIKNRDSAQSPVVLLKEAFMYHKNSEFIKAKQRYNRIIKEYAFSQEASIAKLLLEKISARENAEKDIISALKSAESEKDPAIRQYKFYSAALMQLGAFDMQAAIESLNRAGRELAGTDVYYNAGLRLAWSYKIAGDKNQAAAALNQLIESGADDNIKLQAKYQLSLIYSSENKKELAGRMLDELIADTEDPGIKPKILYSSANINLFDIRDKEKAGRQFKILIDLFPADALAHSAAEISDKYTGSSLLDVTGGGGISGLMSKSFIETIIPENIQNAINAAAVNFTTSITNGLMEIIVAEQYTAKRGNYAVVKLTEKDLNEYIEQWFPAGNKTRVWNVRSAFEGNRQLGMYGTVHYKRINIKGYISGRFLIAGRNDRPQWMHNIDRDKFLIYVPEKCNIGNIPIPKAIINMVLRPAIVQFNKEFPLTFDVFELDKNRIYFAGNIREDTKSQRIADAHDREHLSRSKAIYGRRNEIIINR